MMTIGNFSKHHPKVEDVFYHHGERRLLKPRDYHSKFVGHMPENKPVMYFDTEQGDYDY